MSSTTLTTSLISFCRIVDVQVNDGAWYHVCLVWTSTSGKWELLKDGGLAFQGDWPYNPEGGKMMTGKEMINSNT